MTLPPTQASKAGYIEVRFLPEWTYISCLQTFVLNFFAVSHVDPIVAQRVSMIAGELLENAVKYSNGGESMARITIENEGRTIQVQVSNTADPEHIEILHQEFATMKDLSPQEGYLQKLKEASSRSDGQSQVGLARVRHEGQTELVLLVEDSRVSVTAIHKLISQD